MEKKKGPNKILKMKFNAHNYSQSTKLNFGFQRQNLSSEIQDQNSLIFLDRLKPKANNMRSLTIKYEGLHQLNIACVVPLLSMVLLFVISPHRQQSLSILSENFQQTNSTFKQTNTQSPKQV